MVTAPKYRSFSDIRREYGSLSLTESSADPDPVLQFGLWFQEVLAVEQDDPTAMVLSTVDDAGRPDSRVVLLKALEEGAFVFYTNYKSAKAKQINAHPCAALNFYWPQMARQVRVRGLVDKIPTATSDAYFASRPMLSQLSAHVSEQSQEISNRAVLEDALNELIQRVGQEPVLRPKHWGGYAVDPFEFEFWQGRDNRLHDRIHYALKEGQWLRRRLAP